MSESDLEKPPPDSEDQPWDVAGDAEAPPTGEPGEVPYDANEADAAEQRREVELNEDDYR